MFVRWMTMNCLIDKERVEDVRTATAMLDSLVYRRVPKGALLLLQNHTRGNQERIFVYEEESRCGSSKLLYIFVNFKSTLL